MIGYSDSAKDAGRMAAAWAQYNAQVRLHPYYPIARTLVSCVVFGDSFNA